MPSRWDHEPTDKELLAMVKQLTHPKPPRPTGRLAQPPHARTRRMTGEELLELAMRSQSVRLPHEESAKPNPPDGHPPLIQD